MSAIVPYTINTARISAASPARYVEHRPAAFTVVASASISGFVYPYAGGARLVDVIVYQVAAGTVGTSWVLDLKTVAGTSLFTTLPVMTLASGANQMTDTKGEIALPSGWTRGVLKTDSTVTVTKGQVLNYSTVETGSYTVHPTAYAVFVFEPNA